MKYFLLIFFIQSVSADVFELQVNRNFMSYLYWKYQNEVDAKYAQSNSSVLIIPSPCKDGNLLFGMEPIDELEKFVTVHGHNYLEMKIFVMLYVFGFDFTSNPEEFNFSTNASNKFHELKLTVDAEDFNKLENLFADYEYNEDYSKHLRQVKAMYFNPLSSFNTNEHPNLSFGKIFKDRLKIVDRLVLLQRLLPSRPTL